MARAEFAHYYGDWIWEEEVTAWVKSLLLFFDGIALIIPEARAEQLIDSDPVLAQPLAELGLLRNYWPETSAMIYPSSLPADYSEYFRRVAELCERTPEGGAFSESDLRSLTAEISPELKCIIETFSRKVSHAKQRFGDDPSNMRALTVSGAAMVAAQNITEVAIQPVIEKEDAAAFVAAIMGSRDKGRAKIMTSDTRHVGLDLEAVPLDEVLAFRSQHGPEYRAYSRDVRQFVLTLSQLSEAEQESALMERRAELDDRADELRRVGRSAFKHQAVSLGFGLAGAAWTLVHGEDMWGATFTAGAAAAGLTMPTAGPIGAAYTYVLQAKADLTR